MNLEGFLFFVVPVIILVTVTTFTVVRMNKTKNYRKTLAQSIGLSFILFFLEYVWWYFQAPDDGLHKLFGILNIGVLIALSIFLNVQIVSSMKKKFKL